MATKARNIGVQVSAPQEVCDDKHCPFHGTLPVRGRNFTGLVVVSKTPKMATVEWERKVLVPKYERFRKLRTRLVVHNPPCINAKLGDFVKIMECRPVSKMKHFVIVAKVGKEELIEDLLLARERIEDKNKEDAKVPKQKAKEKEESPAKVPSKKSEEKQEE